MKKLNFFGGFFISPVSIPQGTYLGNQALDSALAMSQTFQGIKVEVFSGSGSLWPECHGTLSENYDAVLVQCESFLSNTLGIIDLERSYSLPLTIPHNIYFLSNNFISSWQSLSYSDVSGLIYTFIKEYRGDIFIRLIE